jgi:ATP-dependent helicase/nuclease subunit B
VQLELAAQEVTREMGLDEGEFLPFAAAWPATREGYLEWLATYSAAEQAVFASAETQHERQLGAVKLVGRVDRIDRLPDGRALVLDYKTEAIGKTTERIRQPAEDTQLAFYAALLQEEDLRAGYVNVGERGDTKLVEQPAVGHARELLLAGIEQDLRRVADGEALPALGEGTICGFCAARAVCRRDFWTS